MTRIRRTIDNLIALCFPQPTPPPSGLWRITTPDDESPMWTNRDALLQEHLRHLGNPLIRCTDPWSPFISYGYVLPEHYEWIDQDGMAHPFSLTQVKP